MTGPGWPTAWKGYAGSSSADRSGPQFPAVLQGDLTAAGTTVLWMGGLTAAVTGISALVRLCAP